MKTQTTSSAPSSLKVKTHLKAGTGIILNSPAANHNQTLVQAPKPVASLKVKTHLKAGTGVIFTGPATNHNQTLVRARTR